MSRKKYQLQEPTPKATLDSAEYESEIYTAYAAYKSLSGSREHKKWILEYVKSLNKDPAFYSRGKIKDYSPYGIWARMIVRGIEVPERERAELDSLLKRLEEKYSIFSESRQQAQLERTKRHDLQVCNILSDVNVCIDEILQHIMKKNKNKFNVEPVLNRIQIPTTIYSSIISFLNEKLNELYLARDKKDSQLVEGYSFLSKIQLKNYISYIESVLKFCESKIETKKKTRKPRAKKQKSPEKIVKSVKYMEVDESGTIKSLSPVSVVGAKSIFVLNTKTKSIIMYSSKEGETLTFKGTTLLNVETAISKKIRNYEKDISTGSLVFATYNQTKKYFSSLKTKETVAKTRLNVNTIILTIQK